MRRSTSAGSNDLVLWAGMAQSPFIWVEGPEIAKVIALTLPLAVMWSTTVGTIVAERVHIYLAVISA